MNRGKEKCEQLRNIRIKIAEKYNLNYIPTTCTHSGECSGTCPVCEAEAEEIERQLSERGIKEIDVLESVIPQGAIETEEIETGKVAPMDLCGMPVPPFISRRKERRLYKECQIAGTTFHNLEEIWDELYIGTELALVRQKRNRHDKNAIAVALANDYDGDPNKFDFSLILGYIPRTENEHLAAMMDLGWENAFECEISQINGRNPHRGSLYMKIYIVSREDTITEDTSNNIRLLEADMATFNRIGNDLYDMGVTHFRWGGFPPWEHNLPNKGDKIVIMQRDSDDSRLYLMHCLAAGDDEASKYVDNDKLFDSCDDCSIYVLSNIIGPIKVKNHELDFLEDEPINHINPEETLSLAATLQMKRLFDL